MPKSTSNGHAQEPGRLAGLRAVKGSVTAAQADVMEVGAIDEIDRVGDAEEAEDLLARVKLVEDAVRLGKLGAERELAWRRVKLKAERRWGELLPPKQKGGRGKTLSGGQGLANAEGVARKKARKLSEVDLATFTRYVEDDPNPTREGALRLAPSKPRAAPRPQVKTTAGVHLWQDEEVLWWVAKRLKAGATREEMMADAKAGANGWPLSVHLPQNAAMVAMGIVGDRQRRGEKIKRPRRVAGSRLREVSERRRRDPSAILQLQFNILQQVGLLETISVVEIVLSEDGYIAQRLRELMDDLVRLQTWTDEAVRIVGAHLTDADKLDKIAKLRDTHGRTEHEAATAERMADRLQRQLDARLSI